MSSSRRLLCAAAVLFVAVCAALPFQRRMLENQPEGGDRKSQRRWRETQVRIPAPLRVQEGESPARDLYATAENVEPTGREEAANRVSQALAIRDVTPPPRIPGAYEPLLKAATPEHVQPSFNLERLASDSSDSAAANSPPIRLNGVKPEMKVIKHRIRDGDSLQLLAARYLGDPNRYAEIYDRNKQRLPSAEVLPLNLLIEICVPR